MTRIRVQRGEHAARLAARFGFRHFRSVWQHPENRSLAAVRNPNLLAAGDEVFVPERQTQVEEATTAQRHTFVLHRSALRLHLRLEHIMKGPFAGIIDLDIGDRSTVSLDQEGGFSSPLSPDVERGRVEIVDNPGQVWDLWIGGLEPVETTAGLQARLVNLGYLDAELGQPLTEEASYELRSALEEFQADEGMSLTGTADPATVRRLVERHGC